MTYLIRVLSGILDAIGDGINAMDTTQWGIFASIMVVVGFMALRSRI